jgi:hypothetical protein
MTESKNSLRDGANALLSIGAVLAKISDDMRAAGLSTSADLRAVRWEAVARENQKRADEAERLLKNQSDLEKRFDKVRKQRDEQMNKRRVTAERAQEWANEADRLRDQLTTETEALAATRAYLVATRSAFVEKLDKVTKERDELRDHLQEPRSAGVGEVVVPLSRVTEYAYDTRSPERDHVRLFIDTRRDSWLHNAVRQPESL